MLLNAVFSKLYNQYSTVKDDNADLKPRIEWSDSLCIIEIHEISGCAWRR